MSFNPIPFTENEEKWVFTDDGRWFASVGDRRRLASELMAMNVIHLLRALTKAEGIACIAMFASGDADVARVFHNFARWSESIQRQDADAEQVWVEMPD